MLRPGSGGSSRSGLFPLLEAGHHEVELSTEELDKLHAWVDLVVPFCGDYFEANAWSQNALKKAQERLEMRIKADQDDLEHIQGLLEFQQSKNSRATKADRLGNADQ